MNYAITHIGFIFHLFPVSLMRSIKLIMNESDFFSLFSSFNEKELKRFYSFSLGAYPNQKIQIRLLEYIYSNWIQFKTWDFYNVTDAYTLSFQEKFDEAKDRKKLFNTLSDLKNWFLDYLIWKDIKSQKIERKIYISKIHKKLGRKEDFYRSLQSAKNLLEKTLEQDQWLNLKKLIVNHLIYFNADLEKQTLKSNEIELAMNNLDAFYFEVKMKYALEILNRKNILAIKTSIPLLDNITQHLSAHDDQGLSTTDMYVQLIELIGYNKFKAYEKLKNYYYNFKFTDKVEHLNILLYLANFGMGEIRKGEAKNIKETLELYKDGLNRNILIADGHFPIPPFRNIVNLSCSEKDFSWAHEFIKDWSKFLPEKSQEDTILISLGRVYFGEGNYERSLEVLRNLKSKNTYVVAERKTLEIRCFYEKNEEPELIKSFCLSLEAYLKRNTIANENFLESCMNFSKIIQEIIKGKNKKELKRKIDSYKNIVSKPWLEKKISEL